MRSGRYAASDNELAALADVPPGDILVMSTPHHHLLGVSPALSARADRLCGPLHYMERRMMPGFKDNNFNERSSAAAKARKAMVERFRAQPGPDDPAIIELRAKQKEIADAREARAAERRAAKEAEAARLRAEEAARLLEQKAREAEAAKAAIEAAARELARQAELKAARDARYAARKARR
jgi:Family of unknown function (DUF6481)